MAKKLEISISSLLLTMCFLSLLSEIVYKTFFDLENLILCTLAAFSIILLIKKIPQKIKNILMWIIACECILLFVIVFALRSSSFVVLLETIFATFIDFPQYWLSSLQLLLKIILSIIVLILSIIHIIIFYPYKQKQKDRIAELETRIKELENATEEENKQEKSE